MFPYSCSDIFDTYFDRDLVATDDEDPGHNAYGKLPHLASAMREVERRTGGMSIERDDILLVDDDNNNIMIAGAQQLKTVRFRAGDVNRAFGEIGEMFSKNNGNDGGDRNFGSPAISRTGSMRSNGGSMSDGSPGGGGNRGGLASRLGQVGGVRRSRANSGLRSMSSSISQLSKK